MMARFTTPNPAPIRRFRRLIAAGRSGGSAGGTEVDSTDRPPRRQTAGRRLASTHAAPSSTRPAPSEIQPRVGAPVVGSARRLAVGGEVAMDGGTERGEDGVDGGVSAGPAVVVGGRE